MITVKRRRAEAAEQQPLSSVRRIGSMGGELIRSTERCLESSGEQLIRHHFHTHLAKFLCNTFFYSVSIESEFVLGLKWN